MWIIHTWYCIVQTSKAINGCRQKWCSVYAVVLQVDNWDGMLQISPQHTTQDTLNTLLDKAESICLLKKLLSMFFTIYLSTCITMKSKYWESFHSLFALWSGSIMFSLIHRVCHSGVLDKKRFHLYLIYALYDKEGGVCFPPWARYLLIPSLPRPPGTISDLFGRGS